MAALAFRSAPASHVKARRRAEDALARRAKLAQERALAAAIPRTARRIRAAFLAVERRAIREAKEATYPLAYSEPEWDPFERELRQILTQEYISLGQIAAGVVADQLAIEITFDLNERILAVADIGKRVRGITDDSRDALRKTIADGIDDGVHPSVIAKRLQDQLRVWAGLEDLTRSRAYTIARTETATAFNVGAITGYRGSGLIEKVRVLDGTGCGWLYHDDPDTANGKIVSLDEAQAHPIAHPNCLRAFAPVAAGL